MQGRILTVDETRAAEDPYHRMRYGFWFSFVASLEDDAPIVSALRRLPWQDRVHNQGSGNWWIAAEHLPVLRRLFPNFDECFCWPESAEAV